MARFSLFLRRSRSCPPLPLSSASLVVVRDVSRRPSHVRVVSRVHTSSRPSSPRRASRSLVSRDLGDGLRLPLLLRLLGEFLPPRGDLGEDLLRGRVGHALLHRPRLGAPEAAPRVRPSIGHRGQARARGVEGGDGVRSPPSSLCASSRRCCRPRGFWQFFEIGFLETAPREPRDGSFSSSKKRCAFASTSRRALQVARARTPTRRPATLPSTPRPFTPQSLHRATVDRARWILAPPGRSKA